MKKNKYRNDQNSPIVETVDDFVVPRNQGARLSNSRDGKVTRPYHYQGGKGTEPKPLVPYFGKIISKPGRPRD